MERSELVRRLVLNEICDDYENVDQIIPQRATSGLNLRRRTCAPVGPPKRNIG